VSPEIHAFPDRPALADAAAARIVRLLEEAVRRRGSASLALAGGSTPRPVYERLARAEGPAPPWKDVHLFWGDERCVSPDHPASNFGLAAEILLSTAAIPDRQVHRIEGERPATRAAASYERVLRARFASAAERPALDVTLLGLGVDGHTASLFPGLPVLDEARRWVRAVSAPASVEPRRRVTLTLPLLNRSRHVVFLAAGPEKRHALAEVLAAPGSGDAPLPAARVRALESVCWFVTQDALG